MSKFSLFVALIASISSVAFAGQMHTLTGTLGDEELVAHYGTQTSQDVVTIGGRPYRILSQGSDSIEAKRLVTENNIATIDETLVINLDAKLVNEIIMDPVKALDGFHFANSETFSCEAGSNALVFLGDNLHQPYPLNAYCVTLRNM